MSFLCQTVRTQRTQPEKRSWEQGRIENSLAAGLQARRLVMSVPVGGALAVSPTSSHRKPDSASTEHRPCASTCKHSAHTSGPRANHAHKVGRGAGAGLTCASERRDVSGAWVTARKHARGFRVHHVSEDAHVVCEGTREETHECRRETRQYGASCPHAAKSCGSGCPQSAGRREKGNKQAKREQQHKTQEKKKEGLRTWLLASDVLWQSFLDWTDADAQFTHSKRTNPSTAQGRGIVQNGMHACSANMQLQRVDTTATKPWGEGGQNETFQQTSISVGGWGGCNGVASCGLLTRPWLIATGA